MEKRELKFRIWNGIEMEYNIMVGKFGIFYVNPSNNGIDENDTASLSPFNTKYPDDIPVMQFTGLIDKTGKEIYEGDLIKLTGGLRLEFYPDNGQIVFNKHSGSFVMKALNEHGVYMNFSLGFSDGTEIEITGNIYQNQFEKLEAGGKN